jgi:hypothetical protein
VSNYFIVLLMTFAAHSIIARYQEPGHVHFVFSLNVIVDFPAVDSKYVKQRRDEATRDSVVDIHFIFSLKKGIHFILIWQY